MENRDIISILRLAASVMELHDTNPFKVRSLNSAIFKLDKVNEPLSSRSLAELEKMDGIGKGIAAQIHEIATTGTYAELTELLENTPKGVIEMLSIKGIGPKKIRTIWKELNLTSKQELLEACNEDRISKLKGFGAKTQEMIKQALLFVEANKEKFMYAGVEGLAMQLEQALKAKLPTADVSLSGEVRRKMEIIETIQVIIGADDIAATVKKIDEVDFLQKDPKISGPFAWRGRDTILDARIEIKIYKKEVFGSQLMLNTGSKAHLLSDAKDGQSFFTYLKKNSFGSEEAAFEALELPYIAPELREGLIEMDAARENKLPRLIKDEDLKGILHNHTTYSDGANTLREMAEYCKELGYEYLGISDHSKSAFYANGLLENHIADQHAEIDKLNKELAPFKIFKGIESDILNNGELDYDDSILSQFDFIVSSVHSNLKMNINKATERLITAIENPYTTILGHATGRLLLKREGYPIDYKKVIDACAANKVSIEINANPRRLDMDWRWIIYALQNNIRISINPDAHSTKEYHNMKYGVYMGRKAGLTKEMTLNALSLKEIEKVFKKKD